MKVFNTKASLALAKLKENQYVETYGELIVGDSGASRYFIEPSTYTAITGDVVLANGNVARRIYILSKANTTDSQILTTVANNAITHKESNVFNKDITVKGKTLDARFIEVVDGNLEFNGNKSFSKDIRVEGVLLSDLINNAISNISVPSGFIMGGFLETAPTGWLLADHTYVLRADYPTLFAAIGTKFGSTSALNFRLPPAEGRVLRGIGGDSSVNPDKALRLDRGDGVTGNNVGTLEEDALKKHKHTQSPTCNPTTPDPYYGRNNAVKQNQGYAGSWDLLGAPYTETVGSNETRMKNIGVNWFIKI